MNQFISMIIIYVSHTIIQTCNNFSLSHFLYPIIQSFFILYRTQYPSITSSFCINCTTTIKIGTHKFFSHPTIPTRKFFFFLFLRINDFNQFNEFDIYIHTVIAYCCFHSSLFADEKKKNFYTIWTVLDEQYENIEHNNINVVHITCNKWINKN